MVSTTFASLTRPGTFLVETTAGYRAPELASFNTVYMVGSSTSGDYNTPTLCVNLTDFINQFGSSPSEASVKLFFRNDRQGKLFFLRTQIADLFEVTIADVTAGDVVITINGTTVTTTLLGSETDAEAQAKYILAINASAIASAVTAVAGDSDDTFLIRSDNPATALTVTESDDDITVEDITPESLPTAADYIYAVENTFDALGGKNLEQGFLIAPEGFQNLATASDRLALGTAMENLCADKDFDWLALVDCGPNLTTVAQVQSDGQQYSTPQGHLAYYAPYVIDLEDGVVPSSAAIAGLATRRYRTQGFHQPPAGAQFPVQGVKDVQTRFGNTQQSVLNPLGVNLVRFLLNLGVVAWGARTRSSNSFYTFVNTRVILNALNGTLRDAFDYEIFSTVDGFGILFSRIQETARSICRRFWLSGAFYGQTEQEAFACICDRSNNQADDLENGNVLLEVYVAPSPTLEKLLVNTIRVGIGQVESAAAAGQTIEN
ncbi:phage tail sheath family protein [Nodosilinea sp. LEGE 07298]|uniref:phage tail sheath subtilisin-like domain-containing protein n=1 Tax=Nodosilinea sp. LEGE 07298 TaxID=2777970 RepID=UPI0018802179|nr:phage tail sheath subtilisin-like domain-containing protein [Nodosilinea sp. LEGE 07298]MBE9110305.1 phage tail sheath family protein [Nodosilinea sp. LEGE 07298]